MIGYIHQVTKSVTIKCLYKDLQMLVVNKRLSPPAPNYPFITFQLQISIRFLTLFHINFWEYLP